MRVPYHDMSADSFERLVVSMCVELLGPSVQPFSTGPDGGRDARFVGTAERFPSESSPISGKFVIQAKHTEHPFAKFSDSDFVSDAETSTLSKEIPRISSLVNASDLDVYFLFSNRRLAGVADHEIRDRVTEDAGVARVELFGVERMDLLLRKFPEIARTADIKLLSAPLLISPDDLAEVICALDRDRDAFASAVQSVDHLERVPFAKKNTDNGLTPEFAKEIRSKYMPNFDTVRRFLAQPGNEEVVERYRDAASELHEQILAHRADYDNFDRVLVRLAGLLFDRDGDLARRKRLTKLLLYYMYGTATSEWLRMLRPHKHSDPELTILPVAGRLLAYLRAKRTASVAAIREHVCAGRAEMEPLLMPAIDVLFLLGLIKYRRKADAFEYLGP